MPELKRSEEQLKQEKKKPSHAEMQAKLSEHHTANAVNARDQHLGKQKPVVLSLPDKTETVPMPAGGLPELFADRYPDEFDDDDALRGRLQRFMALNPTIRDPDTYRAGQMVRVE